MSITFIGLIIFGLSAGALLHSLKTSFLVFCCASYLGAAAAIFIGGANIPPGHLALGFLAGAVIMRRNGLAQSLQTIVYPRAGFFLLMFTVWAVISAIFLPRLFAGQITVFPLRAIGRFIIEGPLQPSSSNINQSIYAIGNLAAFMVITAMASAPQLHKHIAKSLVVLAGFNIAFAIIDLVSFQLGFPQILDFIRNADFAQAFNQRFLGFKRVNGAFSEPSAFVGPTVAIFAVMFRLWRGGIMPFWTGWMSIGSAFFIALAFSSTGYVALFAYLAIIYSRTITLEDRSFASDHASITRRAIFVSLGPIAALFAVMAVAFRPDLLEPITSIFSESITNKLTTDSGVERLAWTNRAFANFVETAGLGAGLGSVRGSGFISGLVGSVGLIGTVLFALFLWRIFKTSPKMGPAGPVHDLSSHLAAAARSGMLAKILASSVSSTTVDQGLIFFSLAGIAIACEQTKPVFTQPIPMPQPDPLQTSR